MTLRDRRPIKRTPRPPASNNNPPASGFAARLHRIWIGWSHWTRRTSAAPGSSILSVASGQPLTWHNHAIMQFFDRAGFELSKILVLDCAMRRNRVTAHEGDKILAPAHLTGFSASEVDSGYRSSSGQPERRGPRRDRVIDL